MQTQTKIKKRTFTGYEKFVVAILTILQFTIILDFMVLSPLGAVVMPKLSISTSQFGMVVSAYAFSAGLSGFLAAGFADRYDRKKILLFFYAGFIIGTLMCALAETYFLLLLARVISGVFGGVLGAVGLAIITDLFSIERRGRVMGFIQMAFAASQVLGIPVGLVLANNFGWNAPFWLIAVFSIVIFLLVYLHLKPVNEHLKVKSERKPFAHLLKTISDARYLIGFSGTTLLAVGGFMLMPFASAFSTLNLGLSLQDLPLLYGVTGVFSMVMGPLIGKFCDRIGNYKVFVAGSAIGIIMVWTYTHLGTTPLWLVIGINVLMFAGITARIISSGALTSAVPRIEDRGAFMSINSSIQQISGGIGAAVAGLIVLETPSGLLNYDLVGNITIAASIITIGLLYLVNKMVTQKQSMSEKLSTENKVVTEV